MPKITIKDAARISNSFLAILGFEKNESSLITRNLVDAEMSGKKTHGLIRLLAFRKKNEENKLNKTPLKVDIISESPVSLYIHGHNKLGYGIVYKSLNMAIKKAKKSGIVAVGIKDLGMTGYIGSYARISAENNFIFIAFNSSPKGLVPYGSKKDLWGTNPLTVAIPTSDAPVILDMASTMITWGDLMVAINEGKAIPSGVAIDKEGNSTTDPNKAMKGGLLPFSGYKGSGLGFIVELLGGALTRSRVGYSIPGGGGTFYILISPSLFCPLLEFKNSVRIAINELKNSPKMKGFEEILFPGEKSHRLRSRLLKEGYLSVSQTLFDQIKKYQ